MRNTIYRAARGSLIALVLSVSPIYTAHAADPVSPTADVVTLDPGDFVWRPQASQEGPVEIVVSLPLQLAYVYRGGTLIGATTVSTGKPGHETPTGSFEILQKRREHYSNLYDNAPMPFMQRLTWDGIALHAGQIPGQPASHGCVRLPMAFARHLFGVTQLGANVHIIDAAPSPQEAMAYLRSAPSGVQLASGTD
jgi:lipoprotein-anchoring transpeptidase ErfK/SrfK